MRGDDRGLAGWDPWRVRRGEGGDPEGSMRACMRTLRGHTVLVYVAVLRTSARGRSSLRVPPPPLLLRFGLELRLCSVCVVCSVRPWVAR